MEKEARENLMKTAPHLLNPIQPTTNVTDDDGLDPINEDEELDNINDNVDEEETEEDDLRAESNTDQNDEEAAYDYEDEEDEDSFNPKDGSSKQRKPRDSLLDADEELSRERKRNDSSNQDQNGDSNSEIEDSVKILPNSSAKKEISAEDEEFMKQFDSILVENIAVFIYQNILFNFIFYFSI